jgi:hypothetical protein
LADNITFNLSSQNIVLPSQVVYNISFNTSDYGTPPLPAVGPWNSLNVGVSDDTGNTATTSVTVGSDPLRGDFLNSTESVSYCNDSPTAGTGTFQYDPYSAPCTGGNAVDNPAPGEAGTWAAAYPAGIWVPAVQFNVTTPVSPDLYPGGPSQPINFNAYNPGSIPAALNTVTIGLAYDPANDYIESTPGDTNSDVVGCYEQWFTINQPPAINGSVAAGTTWDDSPSGASIVMPPNSTTNQDACEGAAVGLTFTAG